MKRYCLGFVIIPATTKEHDRVVLILRQNPAWQEGAHNGIGGHVEILEASMTAMERESIEELGLAVAWQHFASLYGTDRYEDEWEMDCFVHRHRNPNYYPPIQTDVGDPVITWPVARISEVVTIANIQWLLPMASIRSRGVPKVHLSAGREIWGPAEGMVR